MKRLGRYSLAVVLLLCLSLQVAEARQPEPRTRIAKTVQTAAFGERALININNVSLWFRRDGYSAGNPYTDNAGVTYPRSTGQVIYRDGLVWGGRVLDGDPQELRVGGQTYAIGTVPGRILSKGVAESPGDPGVRIYRIRRDYRTADLRLDAAELLNVGLSEVTDADVAAWRAQYDKDWKEWPVAKGAPYDDRDGNGQYDPKFDAQGNPDLSGDEPGVADADQVAWFALNDLDPGAVASLYGSNPIGLEAQVTLWAYARTDALGEVIFKRYRVIYKGRSDTPDNASIKDMYFSQWSDPDLGDAGDDFAGCDVDLNLGYVFNSSSVDARFSAFGLAPPAAGYAFLQGPVVPDPGAEALFGFGRRRGYRNLPMTSFAYFAAGSSISDPELGAYTGTLQWYNLLRGFQPQTDVGNPVPYTDPQGNPTLFSLNGIPTLRETSIQVTAESGLGACKGNPECMSRLIPKVEIVGPGKTTGGDYTLAFGVGGQSLEVFRGDLSIQRVDPHATPDIELPEDGIAVHVPRGAGMLSWEVPTGERWWTWAGAAWGAEGFGPAEAGVPGAITGDPNGAGYFSSSTVMPEQVRKVEIRFTSAIAEEGENQYKPLDLNNTNVSYAYRYLRRAVDPAPALADQTTTGAPYDWSKYIVNPAGGYPYQDRSPICLSAWDVDSNPPRRLEVGFLENNVPGGLVNGAYGPAFNGRADNVAAAGPREWLYVFDLPYTADPNGGSELLKGADIAGDPLPLMWIVFAARRREDRFPQDGDTFLMTPLPGNPYGNGERFTFHVPETIPPSGWVDGTPLPAGDRRIVLSSGPFAMALGDTQELVVALAGGLGNDNIESLERLKQNVRQAQAHYLSRSVVSTAVAEEHTPVLPIALTLDQNYPNPFNSVTVVRFALPGRSEVELVVYNLKGQQVAALVSGVREAGSYAITWDGRDEKGRELASGVYLYRLQAGEQRAVRKLLLLR